MGMMSTGAGHTRPGNHGTALVAAPILATLTALFVSSCFGAHGAENTPVRELTAKEESALERAEQLLLQECMRDHGFQYWIVSENPLPETREFRYVIDDPSWAAEHGYGSETQREMAELHENDPNQRYFESLTEERQAAALRAANGPSPVGLTATTPDGLELGRSDQGCQSRADRELYGDLPAWFQAQSTVDALPQIRYQRVVNDPGYQEAVRSWAECMGAAGHDYATPDEIRRALPPPQDPLPREREVGLALAEARCALDSGLAETAAALDARYREELRQQHRSAVDTKRRLQLNALPRAYSVIEEATGEQ